MKRMLLARIALMFLLCRALCWPAITRAEADERSSASARALFEQGVSHTDRAEWAEAAGAFRRALALRDSPVIRYNLASALRELGRLVESSELLHTVVESSGANTGLKENAQALLTTVKARIGHLTLRAPTDLTITALRLDEQPLEPAQLGLPLLVDPGTHHVQGESSRGRLALQEVRIEEGASVTLELRAPAATPKPSAAASLATPSPSDAAPNLTPAHTAQLALGETKRADASVDRERKRKHDRRVTWGVSTAAFGVAAAVVLTAILVQRGHSSTKDSAAGDFDPPSIGVNIP